MWAPSPRWLEPLELADVIIEIADDLHDFRDWQLYETRDDEWSAAHLPKYPGY